MQKTLIDSGPLIALFDYNDHFHEIIKIFLKTSFEGRLIATWPVVTEVCHLLDFNINAQLNFLNWLNSGAVELATLTHDDLEAMIRLVEKYSDVPMDLADSSLMIIAEKNKISRIITFDSDYYIYRSKSKKTLRNLLEPYIH
ncbi:PIN domain-containing protein [bacterium]|nr:PIN domain-containing protein [bacterium]